MTDKKRKPHLSIAGCLLIAGNGFLLYGCSQAPTVDLTPPRVPPEKTVVTVNGEPLSLEEFDNEFRLMAIHYSAVTEGDMRVIKRRLFEQVINRRLLVQEARKAGLRMTQRDVDDTFRDALKEMPEDYRQILKVQGVSEEAWRRKLLQEKLARKLVDLQVNDQVQITPPEVEDYYWSHLGDYWKPGAVHARHLVVKRYMDLQKALAGLKKGEDFSKITAALSDGMEKAQSGDWGDMDLDRIPSAYVKIMSSLKPGEVSKPYKDEFGYHLFQTLEWKPKRMQSFEEVRDRIHDFLLKQEQDLRFDQWMAGLKKKATIKVNQDMAPIVGVTLEGLKDE